MQPENSPAPPVHTDVLPALLRYRWTLIIATVLAAATAFGVSQLQTTVYRAEARLLLEDPRDAGLFGDSAQVTLDPQRYVRNQAQFVNSAPVLARTGELFDQQLSLDELDERVEARAATDLDLVTISATDGSPQGGARLANTVAEAYQELVADDAQGTADDAIAELSESKAELQATIAAAERRLENNPDDSAAAAAERDAAVSQLITIEGRANQIAVDAALYGAGVELFERADVPEAPARPQPLRNAAVAAILALLATGAFAWWRHGQVQAVDDPHDPAEVLRAPLLGEVPRFDSSVGGLGPMPTVGAAYSRAADAYHFVVASLDFALDTSTANTIMLTSAKPGDGKTVTALNVATAASVAGRQVVLVDADKRQRGLTRLTARDGAAGLAELADGVAPLESCVDAITVQEDRVLPFVPAGHRVEDPASFFRTMRFRRALHRLRDYGDLTIIDTPPLLAVADTSAIAAHVDGIVIVVDRGTPRRMLEDLRHRLDFVGAPVLGYVFNRSDPRGCRGGYGYGYGYEEAPPAPAVGTDVPEAQPDEIDEQIRRGLLERR